MGAIRQADRREAMFRERVYVFLAFNQKDCFRLFQYRSIIQGDILRFMVVVAAVRFFAAPEEGFVRITDFLGNEFSVSVKVLVGFSLNPPNVLPKNFSCLTFVC